MSISCPFLILLLVFTKEIDVLWLTMPITELLVMIYTLFIMIKYTKSLSNSDLEMGKKFKNNNIENIKEIYYNYIDLRE